MRKDPTNYEPTGRFESKFCDVTIDHYDHFVELMGNATGAYAGWPTDVIDIIIMNSTHTRTIANTLKSEIAANEIPTNNGYTQGAEVLASVTSTQPAAGVWMLDAVNASWSASGGPIPSSGDATDAVIYNETMTTPLDALMFDIDFEASESAGDGTDFIISFDALGICRIT